jgi:arylsulfatase
VGQDKAVPVTAYGYDETDIIWQGVGPNPGIQMNAPDGTARLVDRSIDFAQRSLAEGQPFFITLWARDVHADLAPSEEAKAKYDRFRSAGKNTTAMQIYYAAVTEMDAQIGRLLEWIDADPARAANTVVIFTSDNGAEFLKPWDGWAGPWRGHYFTALEGGLRVPFMVRWPGKVPAGRVSNEIVHGADVFPTLANIAGAKVPGDRPIDGVDQSSLFVGLMERSSRESFPIWVDNRLQAVKWRNWKMHFFRQETMIDPPVKRPVPAIHNLLTDPHEETGSVDLWVVHPMVKVVADFEASVKECPLIPMGTPDPYTPPVEPTK